MIRDMINIVLSSTLVVIIGWAWTVSENNPEELLSRIMFPEQSVEPHFITEDTQNISVKIGDTAVLPCLIRQLGSRKVVWIRNRDNHIIATDDVMFIDDRRYYVSHVRNRDRWTLYISSVRNEDEGKYECQISSVKKKSQVFNLHVIVPEVLLKASSKERFVESGSSLTLTCLIKNLNQLFSFWLKNGFPIFSQKPKLIINSVFINADTVQSNLTINDVTTDDSGNYTCSSHLGYDNVTISLTVINVPEENQAAIKHSSNTILLTSSDHSMVLLLLVLAINYKPNIIQTI